MWTRSGMSFVSKVQRDKGKRVERLAAKALAEMTGYPCVRGAQHKGGPDSPDVVTPPGTHVEVKGCKRLMIRSAWLRQMREEAADGDLPFLLVKPDRELFLFVCALEELPGLSQRLFFAQRAQLAIDELLG